MIVALTALSVTQLAILVWMLVRDLCRSARIRSVAAPLAPWPPVIALPPIDIPDLPQWPKARSGP